jgi:hypothetical protein
MQRSKHCPMRVNLGQVNLSDENEVLLKVGAALNDISLRAYVANALNGFLKHHEEAIMEGIRKRARKYGIEPKDALNRLYSGQGFEDLPIIDPTIFEPSDSLTNQSLFDPQAD